MSPLLAAGAAPPFLAEIVALIVAGAGIAYVCYRLGLVPIIGFLLAGVLIGPNALGLVRNQALVDAAAEIGVILLLFTIGIEFSLGRLAQIKRLIFGGGTLQVVLTTLATMGILAAFGVDWRAGLFTGFLVALSSTAIVLKLLSDRGETDSGPGQVGLGLLIFQDLAVIVMVLLVPLLSGEGGSAGGIGLALGKAALLIAAVLVVARRFMPPLLEAVARTCSPELFLLVVIAICFGTAFLTSLAGVSVSLGAFLAGLLVSESRFSQHAFGEILPLQILFSATFFISVGMLLDLSYLADNLFLILCIVAVVFALKVVTTGISVRALGYTTPVAAASGLLLAQVGEFSFVLERAGREIGLTPAGIGEAGSQAFIASTVLLMVATPFIATWAMRLAGVKERAPQPEDVSERETGETPEQHAVDLSDHVIIAGYGRAARRIIPVLAAARVPYVITTLSPWGANEAEEEGFGPVIRGDYTKQHILALAALQRARGVIIADDDPAMIDRTAMVVRGTNPDVHILVRTRSAADVERLLAAGADRVITDEAASTNEIVADVLQLYGGDTPALTSAAPETAIACAEPEQPSARRMAAARQPGGIAPPPPTPDTEVTDMHLQVDPERPVELKPRMNTDRCSHVDEIRTVYPSARGCEECLQTGDTWVHLRICMTCGHVGCCDSSKNKHAREHFHHTSHPIVRSLEPGESWGWCFKDEVML